MAVVSPPSLSTDLGDDPMRMGASPDVSRSDASDRQAARSGRSVDSHTLQVRGRTYGPKPQTQYAWHAPARAERGVMPMRVQAFCLPAEELSERIHVVWSQHSETLTSLSVCSSILSKHIVSVGSR